MSDRNESLGDASKGSSNIRNTKVSKTIAIGRVIAVDDPDAAGRIRVRIKGVDDKFLDSEIPLCAPFLPKFLNVVPKIGEAVKVLFYDLNNPYRDREYIGPIISQPQKLKEDRFFWSARAGLDSTTTILEKSIKKIPEAEGVYPTEEEIAFQGRDNSDIIFKSNEVLIRAGKHLIDEPLVRNDNNPVYQKLKILSSKEFESLEQDRSDSVTVANKIYLIGRDNNSRIVEPWFSDDDEIKFEEKLHPIVYGDVLVEFMELMREWIFSHNHPENRLPVNSKADINVKIKKWFNTRFQDLLSKNIKAGGDIPVKR